MSRQYDANRTEQALDFDWSTFRHNRISVVNLLMAGRPDGRYLEIGCADNVLFDAVLAADKTGVDPVRGGTHRMTSDDFFAAYDGPPFDVIFIDGLHLYPQVRRDLVNALRHLAPGGWIGMHDMLPRDWLEEHVPQIRTSGWTGDGWKTAFELAAADEIDFRLITIDYGVLVARPTGPCCLPDLSADLADKRFKFLVQNLERLPLVAYEEARTWIDSFRAFVQRGDSASLAK
ncbi:MAG TPA: class I SAM-dependent methyltransferase [Caulobacteraceae bacterium]|nr:class I SAM-dependent methyltransferase [Caulobacteraceae bacterium]